MFLCLLYVEIQIYRNLVKIGKYISCTELQVRLEINPVVLILSGSLGEFTYVL